MKVTDSVKRASLLRRGKEFYSTGPGLSVTAAFGYVHAHKFKINLRREKLTSKSVLSAVQCSVVQCSAV